MACFAVCGLGEHDSGIFSNGSVHPGSANDFQRAVPLRFVQSHCREKAIGEHENCFHPKAGKEDSFF
jgi:hypothetical protein